MCCEIYCFINPSFLSSTYDKIQNRSSHVWKNQYYHLVLEYIEAPFLPPPINLIAIFYKFVLKHSCKQGNEIINERSIPDSDVLIELERNCALSKDEQFKEISDGFHTEISLQPEV